MESEGTKGKGRRQTTQHDPWQGLNQQQQRSLQAIYAIDQWQEEIERHRAKTTRRSRPASEWRWMRYGHMPLSGNPSPLMAQLLDAQLVDSTTPATFQVLVSHGYILCKGNPKNPPIFIQITPAGRKLVRGALSIKLPKRLPAGGLQEWHWRALAAAYAKRSTSGVESSETWWIREGNYGGISYQTWKRLFYYTIHGKECPLARAYSDNDILGYVAQITAWGVAFYERTWNFYHTRYPTVAVPEPAQEVDPFEPFIEQESGSQRCLVCRGAYLMELTRTYQMNRDSTWDVYEQERRRPGTVACVNEIKQCACDEAEICEIRASLFEILDYIARQGWSLSLTRHHPWFGDICAMIGISAEGPRVADPYQVKQALQPLYNDSLRESRNITKGAMLYYYNERLGEGNIYAVLPEPLHRWVLAHTNSRPAEEP